MGAAAEPSGFLAGLAAIVGPRGVVSGRGDMTAFVEDWWGRERGEARCVVLPATTAEVSAVVALCRGHRVPIFPQGGNTSVCYGAIPDVGGGGIVLSLSRMNAILAIDARDNAVTVQAGCILARLQEAALAADRFFPLSLGAEGSCQIGGTIATNAGGTGVLRYGNMRDLVLGLEVVLPDGRIWNGLRTLRKNNTGYDLKNLFVGSEGTLGIVTAASLKLFPRQPHVTTALLAVRTVEDAVTVGLDLGAAFPGELTALELISASEMRLVAQHIPGLACPLPLRTDWFLLVDIASVTEAGPIGDRLGERLAGAMEDGSVADVAMATSEGQRAALWRIRHSVTETHKRHGVGLSHDVAVPIAAVPSFVRTAGEMVARDFPESEIAVVGHLGDGNLHYNVMYTHEAWARLPDQAGLRRAVNHAVYDLAAAHRGTFSAEHGIGALHVAEMARYKDPVELDLMRGFKRQLDPLNLFNPGRVLPAEPDAAR